LKNTPLSGKNLDIYLGRAGGKHTDMEFAVVEIRSEIKLPNIVCRNPFHPDGLPYAALGCVEHAAPL
jgi:hypothetical protein